MINSFFHLTSISLFYLMWKFLVFNIVINVWFGWFLYEIIVRVLSMLDKIVFFLNLFKFFMLLNRKWFCKLLTFYLIRIMFDDYKSFTAFCFFKKIWRISIFSSILKRRRFVWMGFGLVCSIIYWCNRFLNNVLNFFIRVLFGRILYIRNSLRVVSLFFTPSILYSYVNRIWGL